MIAWLFFENVTVSMDRGNVDGQKYPQRENGGEPRKARSSEHKLLTTALIYVSAPTDLCRVHTCEPARLPE
jgi:hypothetical protein